MFSVIPFTAVQHLVPTLQLGRLLCEHFCSK